MTFVYLFLTSLCITGSRFIHITLTDSNLFLFMAEKYSISTIMVRRFKREGTCVYLMADSCCCTTETNTILYSNYPPIKTQEKKI